MQYNNNCPCTGCMGVMEFVGEQQNIGTEIQWRPRIDEHESMIKDEATVLVYRCSSCKSLSFRLNDAFEMDLKNLNDNRYKSDMVAGTNII